MNFGGIFPFPLMDMGYFLKYLKGYGIPGTPLPWPHFRMYFLRSFKGQYTPRSRQQSLNTSQHGGGCSKVLLILTLRVNIKSIFEQTPQYNFLIRKMQIQGSSLNTNAFQGRNIHFELDIDIMKRTIIIHNR